LPLQVERWLRRHEVAPPGVVVGVSGGADSVALLLALLAVLPREVLIVAAHLNHQLRGPDSDGDEEFVRALVGGLSGDRAVRLYVEKVDIGARAAKNNLEGVARTLRYEWLAAVAQQEGIPFVATGHTANDQAETVLHRLLRGSGLQGLRGIAPRRPLAEGVEVIRPLLSTTRAEVLAYLESLGQSFRQDSSNDDPRFTRNRIRRDLLPLLEREYNPGVVSALTRLAEQADDAYTEEAAQARSLLETAEKPRSGDIVVLDAALLAGAARPVVRQMFRLLWQREGWPCDRVGFAGWERLATLVFDSPPTVNLPGVRVKRKGGVVQIRAAARSPASDDQEIPPS
jgi:tRNA(Ile)-lysidine synthase